MSTTLKLGLFALVGSALALGASTAPAAAPAKKTPSQCFYARSLRNWQAVGDRVVNLRVSLHQYYQMQLLGPCPELRLALAVGFENHGGGSWICPGSDVVLIIPRSQTGTFTQRCPARSLRPMSPDEVAALPRGERP